MNSGQKSKTHCMVVHAYYPLGESRVERQAQALIRAGYRVDVICLKDKGEARHEWVDGVEVHRLPVARNKRRGPVLQMLEYLRFFALASVKVGLLHVRRRYGVVQIHNLPDFLVFSGLGARLLGARLILDIHDVMPEFYAASFGRSLDSWPVRLVAFQERLSCRFADHVITVTESWRKTLIDRGVKPEKCTVVMNVADEAIFNKAAGQVRKSKSDRVGFRVLYHGSLTSRYGIDLIIRAADVLRDRISGLQVMIHGTGAALPDLQALTRRLVLSERIHFSRDLVPIQDLPRLITWADVAVVPYLRDIFTDGILPTKLMEYAALGIPVIAARTPAIESYFNEDMVEFFRPGDYRELADRILRLYRETSRREELAENAARFNRLHSWKTVAGGYTALVERLF
ncbi:MAG: glycosyltransferase family 4 protein [Acidobacteriota bacterium]